MEFITLLVFVQAFILDGDVKVRVFELIKVKSSQALKVINRRSVFAAFAQGFVFWLPCLQSRFDLSWIKSGKKIAFLFPDLFSNDRSDSARRVCFGLVDLSFVIR